MPYDAFYVKIYYSDNIHTYRELRALQCIIGKIMLDFQTCQIDKIAKNMRIFMNFIWEVHKVFGLVYW